MIVFDGYSCMMEDRPFCSLPCLSFSITLTLITLPPFLPPQTLIRIQNNAKIVISSLGCVDGLDCVPAQGAMYVMCGIDTSKIDIADDMAFTQQLLDEEFVVVLPGKCFGMPNYFRIFLGIPPAKLTEACSRIADFARSHSIGGTKRKDLGDEEKSAEPTAKQAKN